MRALVCKTFGPPEDLVIEEVDDPVANDNEVIVDIHAAGINFPDMLVIAGKYQVRVEPPFIPGLELAGVVSETGSGVTQLSVGDRVFANPMGGGFAERISINENLAHPLPDIMSKVPDFRLPIARATTHLRMSRRSSQGNRCWYLALQVASARRQWNSAKQWMPG